MAEGADKEKENGQEVVEMRNNKGNHNSCIDTVVDSGVMDNVTHSNNNNSSSNGLKKGQSHMSILKVNLATPVQSAPNPVPVPVDVTVMTMTQQIQLEVNRSVDIDVDIDSKVSKYTPVPKLSSCHTIIENGNVDHEDQCDSGQGEDENERNEDGGDAGTGICESPSPIQVNLLNDHDHANQNQGELIISNGSGDAKFETVAKSDYKINQDSSRESISDSNLGNVTGTGASTSDCADGDTARRHLKSSSLPHGVKLCPESKDKSSQSDAGNENGSGTSGDSQDGEEDDEGKGDKWAVLEEELRKAQNELKAKDIEVEQLKGIRQQVEGELTDLTAALFEEAHKMVQEAKMKEVSSEKSLKEAKMQLDGLQAEVAALKTLLITSTPSRPNLGGNGISIFKKQHKRCPSHNHLQYGRCEDEPDGKEKRKHDKCGEVVVDRERCEVDPHLHELFGSWRQEPTLTVNHNNNKSQFLQKIYTEDIDPCLSFSNDALVQRLRQAVEENSIWVEPIPEKDKHNVPTECALVRCPRICHYRMRFAYDSDEWFDISQLCRDRIAAVCEFLNYLRYIKNGLVKASVDDAYWEIIRLRKQMALAKLGIAIS